MICHRQVVVAAVLTCRLERVQGVTPWSDAHSCKLFACDDAKGSSTSRCLCSNLNICHGERNGATPSAADQDLAPDHYVYPYFIPSSLANCNASETGRQNAPVSGEINPQKHPSDGDDDGAQARPAGVYSAHLPRALAIPTRPPHLTDLRAAHVRVHPRQAEHCL